MNKYVLDLHNRPVLETDCLKWAKWFETASRTVAREKVGRSEVSTVFLGLDHRFTADGPPILWETMVFGGPMSHEMDRCSGTIEQAEAMHARMCEKVRKHKKRA